MEFVEGESLGQKIDREGGLPENEAIRLIAQVAQGLHRAHKQNLVHRDVKPDNILVNASGSAKLADLGLVKETETDLNLTRTGRGLGTPHFMAPEQFRNAKNADARCDIYSLGATLYMMVTGELPFKSNGPLDAWMKKIQNDLTPPRQLVPTLSERLDWAIMRAMSADPSKRPATCREFVEDLTGHSTRRVPVADNTLSPAEIWYLVYKDEAGTPHTVKGNASAIRRSLRDGLLGDASNIRAARVKAGPFEPLVSYPEFRDLVVTASPIPVPPNPPSGRSKASANVGANTSAEQPALQAPHISLGSDDPGGPTQGFGGWVMWALLLLLAGIGAGLAVWWMPLRVLLNR
jgi:serine/threonine protein kinase